MPVATTYFIKAQLPGVEINRLLELYKREILIGGAEYAEIIENTVAFSGDHNSGEREIYLLVLPKAD